VSRYHQGGNIDRARVRQLTGQPDPAGPPPPRQPLHDWLPGWIASDDDPRGWPASLPGVMRHLSGAWARRGEPNVLLVHYDSLSADLQGQMRWLAGQLEIAVPQQAWPALVRAAAFENMRDSADTLVPTAGILKSNTAFFRRGTSRRRTRDPQRRRACRLLRPGRPAGTTRHAHLAPLLSPEPVNA
jgi:aryl sulfotransferase